MPVLGSRNAILNAGRLNAFRLAFIDPALKAQRDRKLTITLDGAPVRIRLGSLSIHDVINDAPNTATLTVDAATPPHVGQRLRATLGVDPKYLLFVGTIQASKESPVGRAHVSEWDCEAIDDTARADWLRPFGAWENVSATTVAQQILAGFAPGFSSAAVQAGLPAVTVYLDGTERVNGALRLLAKLIGGYYYFEDYVLHLFQGDEPGANPDDVTGPNLLLEPPIAIAVDDSQIRTRCFGKGHSEATLEACRVGETRIPIANAVMFNALGGRAISEWQRLTYTGTSIGGTGALVGPGVTPAAAPTLGTVEGTGVDPGTHNYAYTWVTAAGETLPSPIAALLVSGLVPAPSIASVGITNQPGGPPAGQVVYYQMNIHTGPGGVSTPASASVAVTGNGFRHMLNWVTSADMAGRYVSFVRSDDNAHWVTVTVPGTVDGITRPFPPTLSPGIPLSVLDMLDWPTAGGGAFPALPQTLTVGRVAVGGISVGPSGVTARKLYRTAANASPLKFLITIADNTTTTYTDAIADAALGAPAPAADTSGLQMPAGQVLPGVPTMPVSGTGWALPAGGWAILGNGQQIIRYTGIAGNAITGIPPTGPGALTAAVNYNTTITGAPMLIGVNTVGSTGLAAVIIKGAPVNIWVQRDDLAAQSELAARVGGAGIVEHLIVDERRGEPSLQALCDADLVRFSRPLVTVRYTTFDAKSRSGRPVHVLLPQPAIDETLTIQDVTIVTGTGHAPPRFTVTASSIRTSLEDLLRRLVGTLEEGF